MLYDNNSKYSCLDIKRISDDTEVLEGNPCDILIFEDICIRPVTLDDLPAYSLVILQCASALSEDLSSLNEAGLYDYHKNYIEYQYGFYGYGNMGIFLSSSDEMIGIVGLRNGSESDMAELGYGILEKYRGFGYAKKACKAYIAYALEYLGFKNIEAFTPSDNIASQAVLLSLGFKQLTTETNRLHFILICQKDI